MSEGSNRLRARREALLQSAGRQRLEMQHQLQRIDGALAGVDRGLGLVRRAATPPVLLAGGVLLTLLLGRRRAQMAVVSGLALVAQLALSRLNLGQLVRRSR